MKEQYQKYKHILLVPLYGIIYVSWFAYLEKTIVSHFHVIHMSIDNYIPFVEAFIIPYFLWFFYIAFVVVYTMFFHKQDYFKICGYLFNNLHSFSQWTLFKTFFLSKGKYIYLYGFFALEGRHSYQSLSQHPCV